MKNIGSSLKRILNWEILAFVNWWYSESMDMVYLKVKSVTIVTFNI